MKILIKLLFKHCTKKRSFPLKISSVNVTKSEDADLAIFTEEILNGKLHFLCSEMFTTCGNADWRAAKKYLERCLSFGVFLSDFKKNKNFKSHKKGDMPLENFTLH